MKEDQDRIFRIIELVRRATNILWSSLIYRKINPQQSRIFERTNYAHFSSSLPGTEAKYIYIYIYIFIHRHSRGFIWKAKKQKP